MYQHHWKMQFWSKFKTNSVLRLYSKSSQSPDSHKYGGCCYSVLFYKVNWWTFRIIPGPHFQYYVRTLCMLLKKRIAFFYNSKQKSCTSTLVEVFLGEQKKYIYPEESLLLTNENSRESYTNLQYLKYEIKMSTIYLYT